MPKTERKALILTGKLVQDHEFIYPYYRLQEARMTVDVAVPGKETVETYFGIKVVPTVDVVNINPKKYEVLVLPGGAKAMEYLRQNKDVLKTVKDFYEADRVIASICHGAQLLISAGITKGKRISGYYSIKDDINNSGAEYVDAPAVVDGKIVTSPHYKYLGDWMRETLKLLE